MAEMAENSLLALADGIVPGAASAKNEQKQQQAVQSVIMSELRALQAKCRLLGMRFQTEREAREQMETVIVRLEAEGKENRARIAALEQQLAMQHPAAAISALASSMAEPEVEVEVEKRREYEVTLVKAEGRLGLGLGGGTREEPVPVYVYSIDPAGPGACCAELAPGDIIVAVGGCDVTAASVDEVRRLMVEAPDRVVLRLAGMGGLDWRPEPDRGRLVTIHKGDESLGMTITGGTSVSATPGIFVDSVAEGGAAWRTSQVHPGDRILEVDGTDARTISKREAIKLLRNAGAVVRVLLASSGQGRL